MLAFTPNLNLVKPTYDDAGDIETINGNMDLIDAAIKEVQDKFTPDGKAINADKLDGKEATEFAPASHATDGNIHVAAADKTNWNSKAAGTHVSDTVLHTTQAEKNKWNGGANAWVATSVTMVDSNHGFSLTIPNFVATEGCTVTFKAPRVSLGNAWTYIQINSGMWALRTPTGQFIEADAWVANATISVTLSFQIFQVAQSGDGRGGTAFFKAGGAGAPKFPTYTGAHAIFGTEKQGYMELYSSGTLTPQSNLTAEVFLVGGGGSGGYANTANNGMGGGGGGYTMLRTGYALQKGVNVSATIGAGGARATTTTSNDGGTTAFGGLSVLGGKGASSVNGGNGGSGGGCGSYVTSSPYVVPANGGSNGSDGATSTNPNLAISGTGSKVSTTFNGRTYAGGGGGGGAYDYKSGGLGMNGGGNGGYYGNQGVDAIVNTGSGGGGCAAKCSVSPYGGAGGSGIVIIRWGY